MFHRHRFSPSIVLLLLLPSALLAQTTTLADETGNNTSTADSFAGQTNGNPPAGNVSKLPIRSLLYPGSTTKIYAHLMAWFCVDASGTCNSHVQVGYNSNDAAQVRRQIDDMMSRGIQGAIVDWYGPSDTVINNATLKLRDEAETRLDGSGQQAFEFAITEDGGALKACAQDPNCSVTTKLINDLNYAAANFYSSPAYMRRNNRPVVFFFSVAGYSINWTTVRNSVNGNPLFIFRNSSGFGHAQSDGAFSWLSTADQPMSLSYLDGFYSTAQSRTDDPQVFGSGFKGFDDSIASWGENRLIRQLCGKTWLESMKRAGSFYSSSDQLENLQIVTWNDYEEGSALEPGIDNCYSLSASVSGSTLSWSLTAGSADATTATIDHFEVFDSSDGQHLTRVKTLASSARSVDLGTLTLGPGERKLFVKAVGKPSIRNLMAGPVTYTNPGGCTLSTVDPSVTICTPKDGDTVISPVRISARPTSSRPVSLMQIYVDGRKEYEVHAGTLDTELPMAAGNRRLTVQAYTDLGTIFKTTEHIDVCALSTASPSVTICTPAPDATVASPVRVVAGATSANPVTRLQIYLDGSKVYEVHATRLDTSLSMSSGTHRLTVQAYDNLGTIFKTTEYITVP